MMVAGVARPAAATDYPFTARFDWRSVGEIYQVWLHREFDGLLVQTAPIELEAGPELQRLLADLMVECTAITAIGLPNWSTTEGICTLSRPNGSATLVVENCTGTQKRCEGTWQITGGTGDFANLTGEGTVVGNLVEPDPLPWFWTGETRGYNILTGFIAIP